MDKGTIVFHNDKHIFDDMLRELGVSEKSLCLSDAKFLSLTNHKRQLLFHKLFNANHLWSYVCKPVMKRDGSSAYKVLNSNNNVNEVLEIDIYFAVKMNNWTFSHWAEMKDIKTLSMSNGGNKIMKKPSDATKRGADKVTLHFGKVGHSKDILYGIVSCKDGAKYPNSHPLNAQWDSYSPYHPKRDAFGGYFKNKAMGFNDKPTDYWGSKSTLHAVPFLRDNIMPTTFSVVSPTKSYGNRLCMFINYPDGLPFRIQ